MTAPKPSARERAEKRTARILDDAELIPMSVRMMLSHRIERALLAHERAAVEREREAMKAIIRHLADQYPISVWPEISITPESNESRDRVSASMARHVCRVLIELLDEAERARRGEG